jgi:ABC-type sugar transport system ATPase subunit
MSVKQNLSLANLRALADRLYPFINFKLETVKAREYVDRLGIKVANLEQRVATLSGGNQQKVVVGRWLQRNPIIFFMDEPTRGLDVGAKADIRTIIGELAAEGAALLVISSDIDEIMSMGDRFLVMYRGRLVKELGDGATKEELMTAAAGV